MRHSGRRPRKDWLLKPMDENFSVKRMLLVCMPDRTVGVGTEEKTGMGQSAANRWPWGGQIHGHDGSGRWGGVAGMGRYLPPKSCCYRKRGSLIQWTNPFCPSWGLYCISLFLYPWKTPKSLKLPWELLGTAIPRLAWISKIPDISTVLYSMQRTVGTINSFNPQKNWIFVLL